MDKSLVRYTNKITLSFFFFGKCTKMKIVSLKRKHCNTINDNIFMEYRILFLTIPSSYWCSSKRENVTSFVDRKRLLYMSVFAFIE